MTSPSGGVFNMRSPSIKRIMQESRELARCPDPTLTAAPLEHDLFEWHFTLTGPPGSTYSAGIYHGRIVLPPSYPLRPPSFRFLTPSGRFETNREICLSISGHHEETWQPAWGIRTALCAIRAFMAGDARGQVGGLDMPPAARERLARESRTWRCPTCGGRPNEDIMRDCEATWRAAHSSEGDAKPADQTVPDELRLAFREDLQTPTSIPGEQAVVGAGDTDRKDAGRTLAGPGAHESLSEQKKGNDTAAVKTATAAPANLAAPVSVPTSSSLLSPTPTVRGPTPASPMVEPLPGWIDKAIFGLVFTLIVMIFRKMTGSPEY